MLVLLYTEYTQVLNGRNIFIKPEDDELNIMTLCANDYITRICLDIHDYYKCTKGKLSRKVSKYLSIPVL